MLALKSGKYRLYDDRGCLLRDGFRIPGKRRMWDRLYEGNLIADRFGLWDPLDDHYAVRWQYPQYVSELTPGKFRRLGIEITVDSRRGLCGAFLKYYKTRNRNPFVVDRSPLLVFSTQTGALLDDIDINEALGIHLTHLLEGGWIRHGFRLYRLRDLYDKGEKLTVVLPQTGDPMFFDHITRLQAENKATNRTEIYQMEWEYDLCQEVSEPDNAHPL